MTVSPSEAGGERLNQRAQGDAGSQVGLLARLIGSARLWNGVYLTSRLTVANYHHERGNSKMERHRAGTRMGLIWRLEDFTATLWTRVIGSRRLPRDPIDSAGPWPQQRVQEGKLDSCGQKTCARVSSSRRDAGCRTARRAATTSSRRLDAGWDSGTGGWPWQRRGASSSLGLSARQGCEQAERAAGRARSTDAAARQRQQQQRGRVHTRAAGCRGSEQRPAAAAAARGPQSAVCMRVFVCHRSTMLLLASCLSASCC
jgi:hypothetical protein